MVVVLVLSVVLAMLAYLAESWVVVLWLVPVRVLPMFVVVMVVVLIGAICEEPLILPYLGWTLPRWKVHLLYVGCVGAACAA